jgi:hypothetical protein
MYAIGAAGSSLAATVAFVPHRRERIVLMLIPIISGKDAKALPPYNLPINLARNEPWAILQEYRVVRPSVVGLANSLAMSHPRLRNRRT